VSTKVKNKKNIFENNIVKTHVNANVNTNANFDAKDNVNNNDTNTNAKEEKGEEEEQEQEEEEEEEKKKKNNQDKRLKNNTTKRSKKNRKKTSRQLWTLRIKYPLQLFAPNINNSDMWLYNDGFLEMQIKLNNGHNCNVKKLKEAILQNLHHIIQEKKTYDCQ